MSRLSARQLTAKLPPGEMPSIRPMMSCGHETSGRPSFGSGSSQPHEILKKKISKRNNTYVLSQMKRIVGRIDEEVDSVGPSKGKPVD